MEKVNDVKSWSHVTVGVASLGVALDLWVEIFGFEVIADNSGPDTGLATLWEINADDISKQALVRTPGLSTGMIHFVEFRDPLPPVRQDAEVFDLCPKNLDIHVQDLPARFEKLKSQGIVFRSDQYSEVTTKGGITFREIHMPTHDAINVVLLEVLGEEHPYTPEGFAGVGPCITIVPDAQVEAEFYQKIMQLDLTSNNILKGPEIEKMVGLPSGAYLDVKILGSKKNHFGMIELVSYQGVKGANRYPLAVPKALGFLHVDYVAQDLHGVEGRLEYFKIPWERQDSSETLFGSGPAISFQTPAGLRIYVHQRDS